MLLKQPLSRSELFVFSKARDMHFSFFKCKCFPAVIYTGAAFPISKSCINNPLVGADKSRRESETRQRMTKEGGNISQDLWDFIVP